MSVRIGGRGIEFQDVRAHDSAKLDVDLLDVLLLELAEVDDDFTGDAAPSAICRGREGNYQSGRCGRHGKRLSRTNGWGKRDGYLVV